MATRATYPQAGVHGVTLTVSSMDVHERLQEPLLDLLLEWQHQHPEATVTAVTISYEDDASAVFIAKGYTTNGQRLTSYLRGEVTYTAYAEVTYSVDPDRETP